jgi:hypothetical protein
MSKPSGLPVLPVYPSGNSCRMQGVPAAGLQLQFLKSISSSRRERDGVAAFWECGKEEPFWKRREPKLHVSPVFMRVIENPVVRYNATLGRPKSTPKSRFPQVFGHFRQISPRFA